MVPNDAFSDESAGEPVVPATSSDPAESDSALSESAHSESAHSDSASDSDLSDSGLTDTSLTDAELWRSIWTEAIGAAFGPITDEDHDPDEGVPAS